MLTDFSLYGRMVFETWDFREGTLPEKERRNVRQAYETAHDYAQNPHNWLVFTGEHGGGKTHLAAAIANYCHVRGEQVILVTAPDLLDYLREAFNPTSVVVFAKRFYEIRSAPLLVIDHLDLSNATPWAREKIHQIADYRYLKRLPTVFTTTQTFEGFDPLLRSRLMDTRLCHVFAIIAPDYAGGGKVSPRRQRKL
jgi:DNA replication protein DnaC